MKLDRSGEWSNPLETAKDVKLGGNFILKQDGEIDEEKEHEKFSSAVMEWRESQKTKAQSLSSQCDIPGNIEFKNSCKQGMLLDMLQTFRQRKHI